MSNASDWSRAHLETLPTLAQSQDADLKVQTPTELVWLSRLTKADGYHGRGIHVDHLQEDGSWR